MWSKENVESISQPDDTTVLIFSETSTRTLSLDGKLGEVDKFYSQFFSIFCNKVEGHRVTFDSPFIQVTAEIKKKIAKLAEIWKDKDKRIFQLKKFFDNIPEGNYISILPKHCVNNVFYMYLLDSIIKLNRGATLDFVLTDTTSVNQFTELFSDVLKDYNPECNVKSVGEPDKSKRCCRFCGKSVSVVTFKSIGHAIPEALGNKDIIDNEECDICNGLFSSTLDNDLVDYFSFYRGIFGIKGKKGNVKIEFANGFITKDENGIIVASQNLRIKDNKPELVELISIKKLISQNIYKALCRVSIGTIKDFNRDIYRKTIEWINDQNKFIDKLPKIALIVGPGFYTERPEIINYIRKTNSKLPYFVSELHLRYMVFVYIVPVQEDDLDYAKDEEYQQFWQEFKHFSRVKGWRFMDFSSKDPEQITYRMNMMEMM